LIKCIASIFIFSYTNLQSVDFSFMSFNRAVVPLLELSFLTKSQKLTSA
jgi:hypothetical protein